MVEPTTHFTHHALGNASGAKGTACRETIDFSTIGSLLSFLVAPLFLNPTASSHWASTSSQAGG
ncbi:MAG: hypothetical protein NTZ74_11235 [Chloroflexi bacterium]|nr:hypothetical protein [Chloroflexota bacterium]